MKFDEWHPDYESTVVERAKNGQDLSFLKQEEEMLKPWLETGKSLLDVGCATAYSYYNFKKYGVDFRGVDIVNSYIEAGRKHLSEQGMEPSNLNCKSIYELGKDDCCDIVICNTMIQHLDEYSEALKKIAEVTGEVALVRTLTSDKTIIRKTITHTDTTIADNLSNDGIPFNVYNEQDLKEELLKHFSTVEIVPDSYTNEQQVQIFEKDYYSYTIFKCLK
ncbi:MAG: methyltransferase domain-containing protein [Bacteriovoracaceae bacterium]|jgi:2-polyprenyl-3-methyl-5-hydroxy-6-metoxy-1,4-benzoquinol methylase|nr:methyltransferase domain-containing protein [Bacteriovoracaceae bacterium]